MGAVLSPQEVLAMLPHREPFRFLDEITELDNDHIVASYTFRHDHDFYRGHFPGNPVTPGVILIETMAQAGAAALAYYLLAQEMSREELARSTSLFTEADVEFSDIVRPGEKVIVTGKKVFFRRRKIRCAVTMHKNDGTLVCSGAVAGMNILH
jgi:3-hydroxyacyl-[acyl-carrier-protein] dehydratase